MRIVLNYLRTRTLLIALSDLVPDRLWVVITGLIPVSLPRFYSKRILVVNDPCQQAQVNRRALPARAT